MKKHFLLLSFLLFGLWGFAQQSIENPAERQIGVDVTALLSQVLNFSSSGSFSNPDYIFSYKKMKKNGRFRFGFGGDFLVDGESNGTDTDIRFNFRFGKEHFTDFAKRWSVFYGGDFKTNLSFVSFGNTDTSQTQLAMGGGPLCGIEFKINSRISLSTEASYDFYLFLKDVAGDTSFGAFSAFSAPDFLYLNFTF